MVCVDQVVKALFLFTKCSWAGGLCIHRCYSKALVTGSYLIISFLIMMNKIYPL